MRQYDRAIESELRCLQRQPKSFFAHLILGWAYERKEEFPEALSELRVSVQLTDKAPVTLSAYGEALAESGDRRAAESVLAELLDRAATGYVSAYDIGLVYAALGDKARAFEWLDKALAERSSFLPYITWDRRADRLRSDPRFAVVLRRLGLDRVLPASAHLSHAGSH